MYPIPGVLSLSLVPDSLRTVLAVKGSRRRAKQRPALDGSGPFSKTFQGRGKGSRCKGHAGNNLRNQPDRDLVNPKRLAEKIAARYSLPSPLSCCRREPT